MKSKVSPMANLNINPCKMCMPLGAAMAFYGIKKCMNILHGSQGCSTYIRRHMATHFNEPVDIASSSLTEEGTVYGGEKNLVSGLINLIEVYKPEVIGISTTCLAETIGEDVDRIIENFYEKHEQYKHIEIINVKSPGYGGTQFEGYFNTLCAIVSKIKMNTQKNDYINVITSPISPADTRFIKELFNKLGLKIILLPDISENLDGVYKREYDRIKKGGTSIELLRMMAGAKLTIELTNLEEINSPGKILRDIYNVPYKRLNLPIGFRDNENFIEFLKTLVKDVEAFEEYDKKKGRYLDAMIDSHKYNSRIRAAIFGEPDFLISSLRMCIENGIVPVLCATGSKNKELVNMITKEISIASEKYIIEKYLVLDDIDFKHIEEKAIQLEANMLIGSSDGRRIEEKLNIPLVRRSFPIHDRIGGQRLKMLGYDGSMEYLDEITNAYLSIHETSFRNEVYEKYYNKEDETTKSSKEEILNDNNKILDKSIEEKTKTHPCFNGCSKNSARIHLPIAPKCNIQCNYCVRKFDCPNESRPGVTTKVLTPEEAFEKYKMVKEKVPNLTVVGIAGPGDALANFEETKRTLELIREYDKDVTFCLSTNGLMLPQYARDLIELNVTHITVTMNAVDPKIGSKIYKYINYNGIRFEGESAAAILLTNQLCGLRLMVSAGIVCKVNIVTMKGVNDFHIKDIVQTVKDIGCYVTNIMPFIQVKGSEFEDLEPTTNKEVNAIRASLKDVIKQMYHCKQCRADAIGTLGEDISIEFEGCGKEESLKENEDKAYKFAIASKSGVLVDSHFGQVNELYIYDFINGVPIYKETRNINKYCEDKKECSNNEDKIGTIINAISDCDAVLAMRIGESPKQKLLEKDIKVFATYDRIETAITKVVTKM